MMSAARRLDVCRQRQRRAGVPHRRRAARARVFFDAEELEVHALALAPGGGLYVGTSPDGKIYKVDADGQAHRALRSAGQVHLGPRRRQGGQRVRRHGRQGRRLQDHAGRKGRAFLPDQDDARDLAGVRRATDVCSSEPSRPDASSGSMPTASRSCCSIRRYNEIHTLRVDRRVSIYAAAVQRPRRPNGTIAGPVRRRSRAARRRPTVSVSTEITAIAIVDAAIAAGGRRSPRPDARARARRQAVYTASCRTAPGI